MTTPPFPTRRSGEPSGLAFPPGFYGSTRVALPLIALVAVGTVLIGLLPFPHHSRSEILIAGVLFFTLLTAAFLLPWERLPDWAWLIIPIGYMAVIAIIRDGQGGSSSGLVVVYLLPIIWLALYGRRLHLLVGLFALDLALLIPVVAVGAPSYPSSEWREVAVMIAVSTLLSTTIYAMVSRDREFVATLAEQSRYARRYAREADSARDRLETLLRAATGSAILGVDPSGTVTFFSAGAEQMLGYTAAEVVGLHSIADFIDPAQIDERRQTIDAMRTATEPLDDDMAAEVPWTATRKDGQLRRCVVRVRALPAAPTEGSEATEGVSTVGATTASSPGSPSTSTSTSPGPTTSAGTSPTSSGSGGLGPSGSGPGPSASDLGSAGRDGSGTGGNGSRPGGSGGTTTEDGEDVSAAGYVVVAIDVTEREELAAERERLFAVQKEVTQSLVQQNHRLRELTQMKDDVVATVSHELRTPITSIRGFIELLLDGVSDMSGDQVKMLKTIDRNSLQLQRVAEDLLANPGGGNGLRVAFTDLDLHRLAGEAVHAIQTSATTAAVTVTLEPGEEVPIFGDPTRLHQLLGNLLSNAIKFSPRGGRVHVIVDTADTFARVQVLDDGPGIPVGERDQLFERFYRLASSLEMGVPGTGLGLAIAKSVAEAHDGFVDISDTPGWSTTFRVFLPLRTSVPSSSPVTA